jgi:hypothetical protein
MSRAARAGLVVAGLLSLVLAAGFFFQMPWAVVLWPWPSSRLSHIFIASILAASGVPVLWIAWSGERAAMAAGALNLSITYFGMAGFSLHTYSLDVSRRPILHYALACLLLAGVCAALFLWSRRMPFKDSRRLPAGVKVSFAVFTTILVVAGAALVMERPGIFPWRLGPEQSVLYGWIFLGAATYFLSSLARPLWANARGQLLGFLAYDLVLIEPFLRHFETVDPALWVNLVVYTAVLAYSGLVAVYYLFIHPETRFGQPA